MRNFYLPNLPPPGENVDLSDDEARHAVRVLRLRQGDNIRLLDGQGTVAEATLEKVRHDRRRCLARARVADRQCRQKSPPRITLYLAPPRGRPMDCLVQAVVALGVEAVVPVRCRRRVVEPDPRGQADRWRQQATVALKQSGNPFLPAFLPWRDFPSALAECGPGFFGDLPTESNAVPLTTSEVPSECALWVGPEGGFSEPEKRALREQGLRPLAVGRWTFRVELAVPVLLAVLIGAQASLPKQSTDC